MLNNSLGRMVIALTHVLREDALPAIADASVRSSVAGALVLLDVIGRRAEWKAEFAEREEHCRIAAFSKLPALLAGTPFAQSPGEPPARAATSLPAESFMAGTHGYANDAAGPTSDYTDRMDDYVARLIAALETHKNTPEAQRQPLRRWLLDYCIATVAADSEKSVASTVGDVTRR